MATDPTEQMRYHILEMGTYNLAEQAGIFCDALGDAEGLSDIDFSTAEFVFDSDEPYEVYFEWFFGDVKAGLSFHADSDDSEWFVNSERVGKRSRNRGRIGEDRGISSREFVSVLVLSLES